MTTPTTTERPDSSLTRDLVYTGRYYLLSRRGLVVLALVAIIAGIAFNWSWLVATGIAPILLILLPCAVVMCGLGLCFNRFFGNSCSTEQSRPSTVTNRTEELSAQQDHPASTNSASARSEEEADASASPLRKNQSLNKRRDTHA